MKEAVHIGGRPSPESDLEELVGRVAPGDEDAFVSVDRILTPAHRRAVHRVRSVEAAASRGHRAALPARTPEFDEVSEQVEARPEREQVRRCLRTLTEIQRQAVTLAGCGTGSSACVTAWE